jgi:hypothetical protein
MNGMMRNSCKICGGRGYLGDVGIDGRVILKWILNK